MLTRRSAPGGRRPYRPRGPGPGPGPVPRRPAGPNGGAGGDGAAGHDSYGADFRSAPTQHQLPASPSEMLRPPQAAPGIRHPDPARLSPPSIVIAPPTEVPSAPPRPPDQPFTAFQHVRDNVNAGGFRGPDGMEYPPSMPIPVNPESFPSSVPPGGVSPGPPFGVPHRHYRQPYDVGGPPIYSANASGEAGPSRPPMNERRVSFQPEAELSRRREEEEARGETQAGAPPHKRDNL